MSAFAALHLRDLAVHRTRAALTVVVLGAAIGLALAVAIVISSLNASVVAQERTVSAGADLTVTAVAGAGMPERVGERARRVPGIATGTPMIRTTVVAGGRPAALLGVSSTDRVITGIDPGPLRRAAGRNAAATGGDAVVVGPALAARRHLRPGDRLPVYANGARATARVAAVARGPGARRINGGAFVGAALDTAQRLTHRPGRVDQVLLWTATMDVPAGLGRTAPQPPPASPALKAAVARTVGGQAVVATPDDLVTQALTGVALLRQTLPLLAGIVLVIGAFLVFTTIGAAARARLRALAVLRAVGATRRHLLGGILGQAAVLGLAGSALGVAAGVVMARYVLASVPVTLLASVPAPIRLTVTPGDVAEAVAAGLVTAVAAAYAAARRVSRVPPAQAMRTAPTEELAARLEPGRSPVLAAVGTLLLAAGVAVIVYGTGGTAAGAGADGLAGMLPLLGATLMIAGLAAGTYGISGALATGTAAVLERLGVAGRIAAGGVRRSPRRLWATALAVAASVGVVIGLTGAGTNTLRSAVPTFASLSGIDLVVQTCPPNQLPTDVAMPTGWADRLRRVPGVAGVRPGQFGYTVLGGQRILLQSATPDSGAPLAHAARTSGHPLGPGRVVVSTQLAAALRLRAGDRFTLPTPTGPHRVTVASVQRSFLWSRGAIALDVADMRAWFARPGANNYEVTLRPGASPQVVEARVRRTLAAATARTPLPVYVLTGPQGMAATIRTIEQAERMFTTLGGAGLVVAMLVTLSTVSMSVLERRREFGVLRALGGTRRRLRRTVLLETAGVVGLGLVIGVPLGLLFQDLSALVNRQSLGLPVDFALAPTTLATAAAACALTSLAGGVAPAIRIGRLEIVAAVRDE